MNRFTLLVLLLSPTIPIHAATVPFDSGRWTIEAKTSRIEQHLGKASLFLEQGVAWIDDEFRNGTLEFDVAFTGQRGFMGAMWRMTDKNNFEDFYVRPHQTGQPDASQYSPVFNGVSGWQLYHGEGYAAALTYRNNEWHHVRIVVSGGRGEIYFDSNEPVLVLHELKHETRAGSVGLRAFFAPAWFADFSYEKQDAPTLKGTPRKPEVAPEGAVMQWRVSPPFSREDLNGVTRLSEELRKQEFASLPAERSGITNLARLAGRTDEADTVFAAVALDSDKAETRLIRFGYSDDVKVFLNGTLIYSGTNAYRSRDYRYLGTIGLFDAVALPLRKGPNEVWFAVTERFGGWGIIATVE